MKHRRKGLEKGNGFVFLPAMDSYAQTLRSASFSNKKEMNRPAKLGEDKPPPLL
jgi:hypothetical protein